MRIHPAISRPVAAPVRFGTQKPQREKLVILGSGPAGNAAAIYAARAGLKPVVVEGPEPGGQLMKTGGVENYPGFEDPIKGPELMARFKKQAERAGARFLPGKVSGFDVTRRPLKIELDGGKRQLLADSVIVATGASARQLGLESEKRLMGLGVSNCAVCDGGFFRNQDVVVVGGGDAAFEEASYLADICDEVSLLYRGERKSIKAERVLQQRAERKGVNILSNRTVEEIFDDKTGMVDGVRVKNTKSGQTERIDAQGVFVAIGHEPNTDPFKNQLKNDASGYLLTRPAKKPTDPASRTDVPGVFAAGDVVDQRYRQAGTASSSGIKAALDAKEYLDELEDRRNDTARKLQHGKANASALLNAIA